MKQRRMWPLLIVGLALILAACGGGSKGPATYAVSGTIVDADGEPMEGVTLAFSDMTATAETDEDGNWSQTGLRGSVTVTPALDGYTFDPESAEVSKTADDVHFTATEGALPGPDPDPQQPTEYTISGTVLDADHEPIEGVKVHIAGDNIKGTTVTTAVDGTWKATALEGKVTVTPTKTGYEFDPKERSVTEAASDVDFTMHDPYELSGVLVDDDDDGIANAVVRFVYAGGEVETVTDDDGVWEQHGLYGQVTIAPDDPAYAFSPAPYIVGTGGSGHNFTGALQACSGGSVNDELHPCELTRIKQVQKIQDNLEGHYALAANIDATGTEQWNGGRGFAPLGVVDPIDPMAGDMFTGTLDGRGHEISGLFINRDDESAVGLFALIGETAVIDNVHLVEAHIKGENAVGAFAGVNFGTVEHSSADVRIDAVSSVGGFVGLHFGTITDSDNFGTVAGNISVGGLAGNILGGVIEGSTNEANVTAQSLGAGGLAGGESDDPTSGAEGYIANSINRGEIKAGALAGGLVGANGLLITDSKNYGSVKVVSAGVGGLVGTNSGVVKNSDNLGPNVVADGQSGSQLDGLGAGGIAGANEGTISGSYNIADVKGPIHVGGIAGRNHDTTALIENSSNDGEVHSENTNAGGIVGLNEHGTLRRVTNRADYVTGDGDFVGGIVGLNTSGTIEYAASRGFQVEGSGRVGGVAGQNWVGTIRYSFNESFVWGTHDFVGGVVGVSEGGSSNAIVEDSYNIGEVRGDANRVGGVAGMIEGPGRIRRTFNAGYINSTFDPAGLVALNNGGVGTVDLSHFDEEKAGTALSGGGGDPRSTEDMYTRDTYGGWNFGSIWQMEQGVDYPDLRKNSRY